MSFTQNGFKLLLIVCSISLFGFLIMAFLASNYLPDVFNKKNAAPEVIIVGGGLAGLSAAIEASRHGAKVTIIDKEATLGGNSAKATSGINGAETEAQLASDIHDTVADFIWDTMKSGGGLSRRELVEVLATQSASAHEFLKSFGLSLTDVVQLGGHRKARTHRFPPSADGKPIPVGFTIVNTLKKTVEQKMSDQITNITKAKFERLLLNEEGNVTGIVYSSAGIEHELHGAVVLTAGGFANDHTKSSLLEFFAFQVAHLPTTNGPWATGDIIKLTRQNNLALVDMEQVQVHPTAFIEPDKPKLSTKFLAPEALRGCGAILLNSIGERFVNELGLRDYVTEQILAKCQPFRGEAANPVSAIMLMNQAVIDKFSPALASFYISKGLIKRVGTVDKLAEELSVDVATIKRTLADYRDAASVDEDAFGKSTFPLVFQETDEFLIAYITPAVHYTMGGILINAKAQAMKETVPGSEAPGNRVPVPGLFAAGEVTGGVHGSNRLGGNSLLECVVFGRIAGKHAAHYVMH